MLELSYPYIYIPMDDFADVAKAINGQYSQVGVACIPSKGKCYFKEPCD